MQNFKVSNIKREGKYIPASSIPREKRYEDNTRENLNDPGYTGDFLNTSSKA